MAGKVLVVEDNELNLALVRHVLEHRGHAVEDADSVASARLLLDSDPPDLVLLDIQMPGGGGEAFLAELRQKAQWASVPVVAVTAYAMAGDRERLLATGFDGYISKPIDTRTFGAAVEAFLSVPSGPSGIQIGNR